MQCKIRKKRASGQNILISRKELRHFCQSLMRLLKKGADSNHRNEIFINIVQALLVYIFNNKVKCQNFRQYVTEQCEQTLNMCKHLEVCGMYFSSNNWTCSKIKKNTKILISFHDCIRVVSVLQGVQKILLMSEDEKTNFVEFIII